MGFLKTGDIHCPVSGSVGALTFRRGQNGQVIVAHKPTHFTVPMNASSVLIRKQFRFVQNLYKALRSIAHFMSLWTASPVKGKSVHNKFLSVNIPRAGADFNPTGLSLSPTMKGFDISGPEITIAAQSVTIAVDPLGVNTGIIPATETKLIASGAMVLSSPIDSADQDLLVVPLVSASINTDLVLPLEFTLPFAAEDAVMAPKYQEKKIILNITSLTAANIPVRTSETFYN